VVSQRVIRGLAELVEIICHLLSSWFVQERRDRISIIKSDLVARMATVSEYPTPSSLFSMTVLEVRIISLGLLG